MRRGFTLVEFAIVLAVLAVLIPLAWAAVDRSEEDRAAALLALSRADSVRTLAETLDLDARAGRSVAPLHFALPGCEVVYRTEGDALLREGCGTSQVLARGVEAVLPVDGGLELTFVHTMRPGVVDRASFFLPVRR